MLVYYRDGLLWERRVQIETVKELRYVAKSDKYFLIVGVPDTDFLNLMSKQCAFTFVLNFQRNSSISE